MEQKELLELIDSLHIPKDENLDAICLGGNWYVKTDAGNLDTARSIKQFHHDLATFFSIQLDEENKDYLLCYSCQEKVVYGELAYWCGQFYHTQCWHKIQDEYCDGIDKRG